MDHPPASEWPRGLGPGGLSGLGRVPLGRRNRMNRQGAARRPVDKGRDGFVALV